MHGAGFEPTNQKDTRLKRASLTTPQTMLTINCLVLLVPFSLERYRFQLKNCCMELYFDVLTENRIQSYC